MAESFVRLMHYDPRWRQEFQQTRSGILQSCCGWVTQVEHIGGTALPGLIARPVIDVLAGVDDEEGFEVSAVSIEGLNFRRQSTATFIRDGVRLAKPRHGESTHQVFLTRIASPLWTQTLAIRDYFLAHPERAVQFEEMKVRWWRESDGDSREYESQKSLYFSHLIDQLDAASAADSPGDA